MSPTEEEEEEEEDEMPTLKVTWKAKKSDESNGGYNQALLEGLFSRYGPLHHVLVSGKRKGKALVSFHSAHDAVSQPITLSHVPLHTLILVDPFLLLPLSLLPSL